MNSQIKSMKIKGVTKQHKSAMFLESIEYIKARFWWLESNRPQFLLCNIYVLLQNCAYTSTHTPYTYTHLYTQLHQIRIRIGLFVGIIIALRQSIFHHMSQPQHINTFTRNVILFVELLVSLDQKKLRRRNVIVLLSL